jgi:tetratricopeptide (TPR) repeat protein
MQKTPEIGADPMQRAHALAQSGDLTGAANICRSVLQRTPSHVYALFMLGSIEGGQGRFDEASRHLGLAAKISPQSAEILSSYGNMLLELKRYEEAIDVLSRAIRLQPRNQNALIYRGLGLAQTERFADALKDFDRVLSFDPRSTFALHNRANVLIRMKRHGEARGSVEAVLRIAPDHVAALANLATILMHEKNFGDALRVVERALSLEAGNAELWHERGRALQELKQSNAAAESYRKAIELKPELAVAFLNFCNVLMEQQRLEDALAWAEKGIARNPNYAPLLLLRGNILLHLGRREESLKSYDAAVVADPKYHEAHYHRGSTLLLTGRFEDGWRDFEHRWFVADCGFDRPELNAADWRGEPLSGRSIVVYSEQGLGDTIQFVRFLPALTRMGAKLTFLCHPNLIRLFRPLVAGFEIVPLVDHGTRFDFKCALMSLPLHLKADPAEFGARVPYLAAEAERIARWRDRIGGHGFKVGLCWQGNPKGRIDEGRSIPLEKYQPLSSVPNVRLISLQKTDGLEQLQRLPAGMTVETLGEFDPGDDAFVDSAAIMQCLDLIITSDTAVPHLAGALGRHCWVALKHIPDWRWMLERKDSPWYPSLQLFRQKAPGDWDSVIIAMAEALQGLARRDA